MCYSNTEMNILENTRIYMREQTISLFLIIPTVSYAWSPEKLRMFSFYWLCMLHYNNCVILHAITYNFSYHGGVMFYAV
jgi:hypothetical protein